MTAFCASFGAAFIALVVPSSHSQPQYPSPTSACGPTTAKVFRSVRLLRTCTPLLPLPPSSFTLNASSKSPYFFLLHKKVPTFRSFDAVPTSAPSL